ncbi:hypothetical protein QYM36_003450 [Artemia franciscana]|uniref:tRNA-queuosine alpha-mannosyltransferase n=2 Tax=Artemia franciscana TaxID=6661 RepID=A0AA88I1E1_ARTSF|nr:hypothetical protein QYM36_003450 [Artemia franciscana]
MESTKPKILLIEPFYGGSHKQLIDKINDTLVTVGMETHLATLTAKKWHWRARVSALILWEQIPYLEFEYIFTSSVLSLAELMGLRPDLGKAKKIVYFHENQLVYPVREKKERDFQYGYNQITTCLVADAVVFNSEYNMQSFLHAIVPFLKLMPDYRIKNIPENISKKSIVLYFPIEVPKLPPFEKNGPLHIVWNHRWEHDKNPNDFFSALFELSDEKFEFRLSVLGESYADNPPIFQEAKEKLSEHVFRWGYLETKAEYFDTLLRGDVVISTAVHEFFGVSMLEAANLGCYPLCPNRLVYPEIFPKECIYNTPNQLAKTLKRFCKFPDTIRKYRPDCHLDRFSWSTLRMKYLGLFS